MRIEGVDPNLVRDGVTIINLHRQIETLMAGWGLTGRQIDILEILLVNAAGLSPAELSDEAGVSRSGMTRTLDLLERRGCTRRTPHPTDRRMLKVSLTPTGREFIEQRIPARLRLPQRAVAALSEDERKTLVRGYRKVLDVLRHPGAAQAIA